MQELAKFKAIGGLFGSLLMVSVFGKQALYNVEPGHKAFKFNKYFGVREMTYKEGIHFKVPWLEKPVFYNVKSQPKEFSSITGSKDLQEVKIKVRVLFRPDDMHLQNIYRKLGPNYDEVVLPSVVNEVLRSVVAQYNAATLLGQREQVSIKIKQGIL